MRGRREFLQSSVGMLAASLLPIKLGAVPGIAYAGLEGETLPKWEPGVLEIHHIDTGRGNSTLILGPDGTVLLIDAGEAHSADRTMAPARPDKSRRAGEWIARYVRRQLDRTGQSEIDVMLLTHLHGDHVGEITASSPPSARGKYKLTGAADVAEAIHVSNLIDRGWPDYRYPAPPSDATSLNYIALARGMAGNGTHAQMARAGSLSQLALRKSPSRYPDFSARIIAVNGEVWTGHDEIATAHFPPVAGLATEAMPTENMCCIALRLDYGGFRYFSGGDLTCDTTYGRYEWHDIETPVAQAAGPVSVAVANHHGYFDACGPAAVRALRPRVWILPSWHVSHPALSTLANLFSEDLYPGERSVFSTGMTPESLLTTERFSGRLSSTDGHVVLRVPPGGREFTAYVIDARNERGNIVGSFGPFST